MVIAREQRQELAEQIIAAGTGALGYALQSADHMAIDDVARALEEHVAWEHAEQCDRFVQQWLPRLAPAQRLAAALAVQGLYDTALVHLPHAEDRGLQQVLSSSAEALGELARRLRLDDSAHSPDVRYGRDFTRRLTALADGSLAVAAQTLNDLAGEMTVLQSRHDDADPR